ncbi:Rad52/Rad22 family DNA repair protein [Planococcus rifietoensis]|uniref:Rad52/Rad22 family DNA repair protein n=1 Tax=Planococcus rifietoensis TaxID=200991 RepID=UPI00384DD19F
MENTKVMEGLKAPFGYDDIEWKVQSATERNGEISVLVVPYLNARAIMDRLDATCGALWKSDFKQMIIETQKGQKQGFSCILSIKIEGEWISRVDGAEVSDIESIKGGYSNALKRAAVQWGIGRYLYDLPNFWVPLLPKGKCNVYGQFKISGEKRQISGKFNPPTIPAKFLPKGHTYSNSQEQRTENFDSSTSTAQHDQSSLKPETRTGKPSDMAASMTEKTPLEHTVSLFKSLSIGSELVPGLMKKITGERMKVGKATEEQLREVVKVLIPVKKYIEYCQSLNLTEDEMLYYAQITLHEKLESHLSLLLKMDKTICNETIQLIQEDRKAAQPA